MLGSSWLNPTARAAQQQSCKIAANPHPSMQWYPCSIWCYLCKMGCYQYPEMMLSPYSVEILVSNSQPSPLRQRYVRLCRQSLSICGLLRMRDWKELCAVWLWLCGPQARVVATVPVHAVSFNEDRRGRWWRVNYNLMLESNTISPFITPECHGLTGSHQFVRGSHAERPHWGQSCVELKKEGRGRFVSVLLSFTAVHAVILLSKACIAYPYIE